MYQLRSFRNLGVAAMGISAAVTLAACTTESAPTVTYEHEVFVTVTDEPIQGNISILLGDANRALGADIGTYGDGMILAIATDLCDPTADPADWVDAGNPKALIDAIADNVQGNPFLCENILDPWK